MLPVFISRVGNATRLECPDRATRESASLGQKDRPESDDLRKQVAGLRAIAAKLKAATEEAGQIVPTVEALLREKGSPGLAAESSPFAEAQVEPDDEVERSTASRLAYGRMAGKHRLHFRKTFLVRPRSAAGAAWEPAGDERTAWSSCPREVKLESFVKLPELLGAISRKAGEGLPARRHPGPGDHGGRIPGGHAGRCLRRRAVDRGIGGGTSAGRPGRWARRHAPLPPPWASGRGRVGLYQMGP